MEEGLQRYYDSKFLTIDVNIKEIKEMVKTMIEKDEDRISMIMELKIKIAKLEDQLKISQDDINNFFSQFRVHCEEHKGWFSKSVKTVLAWIVSISGAIIGLGVITAGLIWLFKTLKLV